MSENPYVNFYTSDFLAGTSGMTAATKGVYITLLCLMYEAEAPLPQRYETLARRCGCTLPAFERALQVLEEEGKITCYPDGLWSEKCEKHIALRCERRKSATAAAKTRWKKTKQKQGEVDATASIPQCQPEPEPEPEEYTPIIPKGDVKAEDKKSTKQKPSQDKKKGDDWFDLFWAKWPLAKQGKQAAFEAFKRMSLEDRRSAIEQCAGWASNWRAAYPDASDIHPATFLNKRRWQDELPKPRLPHSNGVNGQAAGNSLFRKLAGDN